MRTRLPECCTEPSSTASTLSSRAISVWASAGWPGTVLPLTFLCVALFSPKKGHGFFIFYILRTIHHGHDLAQGANRFTHPHTLGNILEVALRRIPITPDLHPNLVVCHSDLLPAESFPSFKTRFCAGICKWPRFYAGLGPGAARQPAVAVAVGMWEPAFDAGFQAPGQVLFGTLHG